MDINPPELRQGSIDFDAIYRGERWSDGLDVSGIPWDIQQAQPEVITLATAGLFSGHVLDVGCGLGDNAIFLAGHGHRVTAVDCSPTAIQQAELRAAKAGAQVTFAVADATELTGYDGEFDTVLDCALFHCLDSQQRAQYLEALRRVTTTGATLHLLCFADGDVPVPFPLTEEEVRESLEAARWAILELRRSTLSAAKAAATLIPGPTIPVDEHGRIHVPIWVARAVRS